MKDKVLETIYPLIKSKDVLDIGCVEHSINNKHKTRIWVHDFLKEHSRSLLGIDYLEKDISELSKLGYNVLCMNAEDFKLDKKFDVIFAGELIEHLNNPGKFLENCRSHLKEHGRLIITTPNAFSNYRFLSIIKNRSNDPVTNLEHTCWYSPSTLAELLKRHEFFIEKIKFVNYPQKRPTFGHKIVYFLGWLFGDKFRETMIVISK